MPSLPFYTPRILKHIFLAMVACWLCAPEEGSVMRVWRRLLFPGWPVVACVLPHQPAWCAAGGATASVTSQIGDNQPWRRKLRNALRLGLTNTQRLYDARPFLTSLLQPQVNARGISVTFSAAPLGPIKVHFTFTDGSYQLFRVTAEPFERNSPIFIQRH